MLAIALIVFREVLEASLVVGIVLAASQGVKQRGVWVAAGIAGGVAGATVVAGFAEELASALAGMGQELFNASVLFTAVVMLGWHNIWMGRHGRELAVEATDVGKSVVTGARPLYALASVVGLAVLREGSELVLFVAAQGGSATSLVGGGLLGLAAGVGVGVALYFGLLRIPMRHLFTVTSWMIQLLAASMAARGAAFLLQADLLPPLGGTLWDTSFILSEEGIPGQVLHALVGYVARPTGIEILFYVATLVTVGTLMRWVGRGGGSQPAKSQPIKAAHRAVS